MYPFLWALHDCLVQSEHIPRVSNTVTDAISRNNLQVLFREVPGVSKVPNPIHPALRQLLVGENCWRSHYQQPSSKLEEGLQIWSGEKDESGLPTGKRGQPHPLCGGASSGDVILNHPVLPFSCPAPTYLKGVWRATGQHPIALLCTAWRELKKLWPGAPDILPPITLLILRWIKSTLLQDPYNSDHILLWAACCLEYFSFFRSGELASPDTNQFNPAWSRTISVASALEMVKNWSSTSRCTLVCGCHRQWFVPNCSCCDIPSSEGYEAGPLIPPAIWTTTDMGLFRGQGEVNNEGSQDGPIRIQLQKYIRMSRDELAQLSRTLAK